MPGPGSATSGSTPPLTDASSHALSTELSQKKFAALVDDGGVPFDKGQQASFRQPAFTASTRSLAQSLGSRGDAAATAVDLHGVDAARPELLEPIPEGARLCLEYSRVSAWVPSMFAVPGFFPQLPALPALPAALRRRGKVAEKQGPAQPAGTSSMRQILFGITGCCRPGEVLALMGPSGSGKTSLLSIVGGRAQKHMKREGQLLFNGEQQTKQLKRLIGYVMQDDLLHESLTVWEVLYYAAMLRLPRGMSTADKKRRVQTVIDALGIASCQDTIIGGFFRKGISGGERKRVSIGHELLINPSVLLLDEPTSGLDSTTAMHVMEILRQLAQGGRSVVTTIHQPSSRLYQTLDKLLLLSKGHALYYGAATLADAWFGAMGYTLPYRVNVADFILDVSSADVSSPERDGEASRQFLVRCAEAYLLLHPAEGFLAGHAPAELAAVRQGAGEDAAPLKEVQLQEGPASAASSEDGKEAAGGREWQLLRSWRKRGAAGLQKGPRWGATYATQFRVLFIRELRTRRFQSLSTQDICQFLAIGVLVGCFWFQRAGNNTLAAASDTIGLIFFECLFLAFRSLFASLFVFPETIKHLLKERASGMYQLSAFYFARTAADIPLDFAVPSIFILLLYWMGGLRASGAAFFSNYFAVLLMAQVAQGLGLLVGTCFMVPKTAQTIASVVALSMVLTGGYFVKGIPVWIRWIRYLSFVFYGFGLLLHVEYHDRTIYQCTEADRSPGAAPNTFEQVNPDHPQSDPRCTALPSLQLALGLQQDVNSHTWVVANAFALVGWLLFYRGLVYLALRRRTAKL